MFVTVIGMNEGYGGAHRAGRYFPNGTEVRLEVLDQDDDPPQVSIKGEMRPDPERIGKASLEALKKDPRIKLLADGATQSGHSKAAYDEARRSAEAASGAAAGLRLDVARLEDEKKTLQERVAQLEKQVAASAAESGAETAPAKKGGK